MPLSRLRGHKEKETPARVSILPEDIPPELQVLLSACRVFLGTEKPLKLEEHLQKVSDWDRLLALASRHGVMPLLYRSISQNCPQAVPQDWLMRLRMLYMQNAARNFKMTGELLRILDALKETGVKAVPLKGPVLAQTVYGDIALRTFCDLDILVQRDDVLRAKKVMISEGYQPEVSLNPKQEELFLKSECEYNFNHQARGVRVEVHWRLNPSCYCIDFDAEDIWPHLRSAALERINVQTLSPEDLLISLCIHGARHSWRELKLVCDLAGLLDHHKDLDWKGLMSYAREIHIERIILLGLLLAEELLGSRLPEEVSDRIEKNTALQALLLKLGNSFDADSRESSRLIEEVYFWFYARERILDRLNCIARLALEPTTIDLMEKPLPVRLYPLYYLIHPARLISKYMINDSRR